MIRHGRPEWRLPRWISLSRFVHVSGDYTLARLAKEGISAIELLARTLPQTLILSSDLARARETAEIIAGKIGKVEFDRCFANCNRRRFLRGFSAGFHCHQLYGHWCAGCAGFSASAKLRKILARRGNEPLPRLKKSSGILKRRKILFS